MMIGGTLGILFVTLLRRVMVEDPELPFPESVAASEIHKAGQQGAKAAKILFANMGFGGFMYLLGAVNVFNPNNTFHVNIRRSGKEAAAAHQHESQCRHDHDRRRDTVHRARRQPGVSGRGLHHRAATGGVELCRRRAGLGTAGSAAHLHCSVRTFRPRSRRDNRSRGDLLAGAIYYSIVRPIAVGGMLVGASYTLFKMRKQLGAGHGARGFRFEEVGGRARGHQPHRARPAVPRLSSRAWAWFSWP